MNLICHSARSSDRAPPCWWLQVRLSAEINQWWVESNSHTQPHKPHTVRTAHSNTEAHRNPDLTLRPQTFQLYIGTWRKPEKTRKFVGHEGCGGL